MARLFPRDVEDAELEEAYFAAVSPGLGAADELLEAQLDEAFETKDLDNWNLDREMQAVVGQRVKGINDTTRLFVYDQVRLAQKEGYSIYQMADGVPAEGYLGIRGAVTETYKNRAETIARTELAYAQNILAVDRYHRRGVTEVEIMDGDGCGWESHDSGDKANGSVRTLEEFLQTPLAHPRCVRVPLPLVTDTLRQGTATAGGGENPYVRAGLIDDPHLITDRFDRSIGDAVLHDIMQKQGFYSPANLYTKEQMDDFVAAGERELWRGVSDKKFADQWVKSQGTDAYTGLGVHGNGIYTEGLKGNFLDEVDTAFKQALNEYEETFRGRADMRARALEHAILVTEQKVGTQTAISYSGGLGGNGAITRMTLRSDAKVISTHDLKLEMEREFDHLRELAQTDKNVSFPVYRKDPGEWAAANGYDAIIKNFDSGADYVVVLNRSALRIQNAYFTADDHYQSMFERYNLPWED